MLAACCLRRHDRRVEERDHLDRVAHGSNGRVVAVAVAAAGIRSDPPARRAARRGRKASGRDRRGLPVLRVGARALRGHLAVHARPGIVRGGRARVVIDDLGEAVGTGLVCERVLQRESHGRVRPIDADRERVLAAGRALVPNRPGPLREQTRRHVTGTHHGVRRRDEDVGAGWRQYRIRLCRPGRRGQGHRRREHRSRAPLLLESWTPWPPPRVRLRGEATLAGACRHRRPSRCSFSACTTESGEQALLDAIRQRLHRQQSVELQSRTPADQRFHLRDIPRDVRLLRCFLAVGVVGTGPHPVEEYG